MRMRALEIFVGMWLAAGAATGAARRSDSRLDAARGFMADGLYELAIRELELVQVGDAGSPAATDAAFLLAECVREQGVEDATPYYEEYLLRSPAGTFADQALFRIGDAAHRRADSRAAVVALGRLIEGFPSSDLLPDALLRRSRNAGLLGDVESGVDDLERVLSSFAEHSAASYARYDLALFQLQLEQPEQAVQTLEPLLSADGVPAELRSLARTEAARARLRRGDHEGVIALLQGARNAEEHWLLGEAYLREGRHGEAIEALEAAVDSLGAASEAAYSLAWSQAAAGRLLDAEARWLAHADAGGALALEALLGAGDAAAALGRNEAAERHFRRVDGRASPDQRARALLGLGLLRPDDLESLPLFEQVAVLAGAAPATIHAAQMAAGRLLLASGRARAAAQAYAAAIEAAEIGELDAADALYGRGGALLRAGEPAAAVLAAAEGAQGPRDRLLEAEANLAAGDLAAAESLYVTLADQERPRADELLIEALFGVGWCRLGQGDAPGALRWFDRLAVEHPSSSRGVEAVLRMGDAFTAMGDDDAAETLYGLYLQHDPRGRLAYEAHLGRARALARLGKHDAAAAAARAARQSGSGHADRIAQALLVEAQARFDVPLYAAAESLYLAAADAADASSIAEHAIARVGDCRFNVGDPQAAAQAYAMVVRSWPRGERVAHAVRGIYWAAAEAQGAVDAPEIVREAIEGAGEQGAEIALHEALILQDRGEDEAARNRLGALASAYPRSDQAAEALYALGLLQPERENAAWRTLIDQHVDHPRARAARLLLAEEAVARGEPERALELMSGVPPRDSQDRLLLGLAHAGVGQNAEARRLLQPLAESTAPDQQLVRWRSFVALALIARVEGDTLGGRAALEEAATEAPPAVAAEALYRNAELRYQEGAIGDALRLFLKIRYVHPAEIFWVRRGELAAAQCYEGKGALEDAKKLYSEIIAADATDPPGLDATARLEELGP